MHDNRWKRWSAADDARLARLWADGVSVADIAYMFHRSTFAIRRRIVEQRIVKKAVGYDADTDTIIQWICDEIEHQKLEVKSFLTKAGINQNRFYDMRFRGYMSKTGEVDAMLAVLGYHIEIVPNKETAHNGTDNSNG
jgi:hypothetical protein